MAKETKILFLLKLLASSWSLESNEVHTFILQTVVGTAEKPPDWNELFIIVITIISSIIFIDIAIIINTIISITIIITIIIIILF